MAKYVSTRGRTEDSSIEVVHSGGTNTLQPDSKYNFFDFATVSVAESGSVVVSVNPSASEKAKGQESASVPVLSLPSATEVGGATEVGSVTVSVTPSASETVNTSGVEATESGSVTVSVTPSASETVEGQLPRLATLHAKLTD